MQRTFGKARMPVFGRALQVRNPAADRAMSMPAVVHDALLTHLCVPTQDFPGQPALVKDILSKLRGSCNYKDMFLSAPSPRTQEKIALMRKVCRPATQCLCLSEFAPQAQSSGAAFPMSRRRGTLVRARCGWQAFRMLMRCDP